MTRSDNPLAEGLYWMAEKLTWGYEGVKPDPSEAVRLYQQAAELGFSDAYIRIGQLQEYGKGTERDPKAALNSYKTAANAGNFFALAFLAKLLSRSSHLEKADALWGRFFAALETTPKPGFLAASCGELLHAYITTQLRLGLDPGHDETLKRYRYEIVGHHQQLLEYTPDHHLGRLEGASTWRSTGAVVVRGGVELDQPAGSADRYVPFTPRLVDELALATRPQRFRRTIS